MVSGDNIHTATQCALKAGIIKPGDENQGHICLNGKDFRNKVGGVKKVRDREGNFHYEILNKQNFKSLLKTLKVLARSTPEDKFTLIVGLRELGHCVGVTADGLNDIDALKYADVGISMG